ncbi:TIGR02285 family protein [Pseudomonas sp.]|uniref:TIGR02285 family protein n=1 Tax=Pseudomonas sp. TaxID=306 RepID=UPI002736E816|nr:TIGR02285 family protein [Pseudomonas sp.]MDP3813741.1 TIGR02285 family protein [Pseudomonas sp.]
MRLRLLLSTVLLCGQSLSLFAEPAVEPDVFWLVSDFKPFMILHGPQTGEGYLDRSQLLLQQLLPGYQHRSVQGNASRREQIMQAGLHGKHQVCSATLFQTPKREGFAVFSRPYLRVLPSGIITLQRLVPRFAPYRDGAGDLQLARIIADRALRMGVTRSRVYGGAVDKLLEPLAATESDPSVVWRAGEDNSEGLYGMLQRGRIDFTLGFAVEELYLQRQQAGQEPTVFLPVAENTGLLEARFSCARTPWGERTVAQVDALLADPALRARFQTFYEQWLNPESLRLYRAKLAASRRP